MTRVIFLCAVLGVLSQGVHLSEAEVNKAKHVTQATLFGDDTKSWLTPYEGVLATENTPVYGLVKKPKVSVNDTGYELIEHEDAMKNVIAYLRESKSDAITTPSTKPPKVHQEQNTVVENKVPEEPARPKTMDDINQEILEMLKNDFPGSNPIFPTIQRTPKPYVPYPSIVYPEILVIVDNALFKTLGSNVRDVVTHILAFWNGVDLLFRNLESPKFRFNIEAILIIEAPEGFTKLEYAPNKIDANQLPYTIGGWLYRYQNAFPLDSYDIAVLMTSNYLISRTDEKILGGISYSAGACKTLHDSKLVAKTTSVTETGDFHAIRNMAHELGHSFGIVNHDGEGDKGCQTIDGIMGPTTGNVGPKYYEWSRCSLEDLTQSFIEGNLMCLYNEIYEEGAAVPRLLPGKIVGLDKQCDIREAKTFSVINEDNCREYICRTEVNSNGTYELTIWPVGPADGSSCGEGKMCLLGNCMQENLIH